MAVFRPISVIASRRGFPVFRPTRMPSVITMALSTSIPIAKMKDASETLCIVPSINPRNRNEPITITTRLIPIISPLLKPIVITRMAMTISTDSIRLMANVVSEDVTSSGWKKTLWYSTPTGSLSEPSCS